MTVTLTYSNDTKDLGKQPFDLFPDEVESQTGNDLSDDALAHKFGNPDEPLTQTVSARQHLVVKMFLLSISPINFTILLTSAFFPHSRCTCIPRTFRPQFSNLQSLDRCHLHFHRLLHRIPYITLSCRASPPD